MVNHTTKNSFFSLFLGASLNIVGGYGPHTPIIWGVLYDSLYTTLSIFRHTIKVNIALVPV